MRSPRRPRPTGRPGAGRRASNVDAPLFATTWYFKTPLRASGGTGTRPVQVSPLSFRAWLAPFTTTSTVSACPCTFTVTSGAAPGGTFDTSVATERMRKLLAPKTGALTTAGSTRKVAWLTLPACSAAVCVSAPSTREPSGRFDSFRVAVPGSSPRATKFPFASTWRARGLPAPVVRRTVPPPTWVACRERRCHRCPGARCP